MLARPADAPGGLIAARDPAPDDLEAALSLIGGGLTFATFPSGTRCVERLREAGFLPMVPNLVFVVDPAAVAFPGVIDVREVGVNAFLPAYGASFNVRPAEWDRVASEVDAPECTRLLAYLDGEVAGCAAFSRYSGAAYLTYAGTLPAFQRRGVHRALTAARLARAAAQGCDLAFGFSGEENPTRHTFRSLGFREVEPFASLARKKV